MNAETKSYLALVAAREYDQIIAAAEAFVRECVTDTADPLAAMTGALAQMLATERRELHFLRAELHATRAQLEVAFRQIDRLGTRS